MGKGVRGSTKSSSSSQRKRKRRKEPASDVSDTQEVDSVSDSDSNSDNDSLFVTRDPSAKKFQSSIALNSKLSTDSRILLVEKEINICVKLKCLLQIDANTNNYVSKILTNVQCESVKFPDLTSRNQSSAGDSSSEEDDDNPKPEVSEHARSLEESAERTEPSAAEATNDAHNADNEQEWTNINLLSSALIKFANSKLHDEDFIPDGSEKDVERPLERIHFSTPEVEQKWRKIVDEEKRKKPKLSENNDVAKISQSLPMRNSEETKKLAVSLKESRKDFETRTENNEPAKLPAEEEEEASNLESKTEAQLIAMLGPIPASNSRMFEGMCFILECFSLAWIDPQQLKTMQSNSEAKYLEEWTRRPFVRDRLVAQITAAGGKLYARPELVPPGKYAVTKLITNIPNTSTDSLFCLSVGIEAYSHQWIIRCCQENKIVNPAEERLPAGWSLTRQSYVEVYQRPSQKPFESDVPFVVVIPMRPPKNLFHSFWEQIIRNSGGSVLLVEEHEDCFIEGTVVLTHIGTPLWAIHKAECYDIPLVTTRWAIQCLIEGQICDYDAHASFEYNLLY